ncbi:MAG: SET domain-containing protein-lysine N-methyltransferase [Spirochaetes bacterium]|nr:SET domain-containing protein-lysine N-methyltransferase [Spirochaetota bacterium]
MKESAATHLKTSRIIKHTTDNNDFEIWEQPGTGHKALHSLSRFAPGDRLDNFGARLKLQQPSYLSVQISADDHILLKPEYLQYMNHSCQPNALLDTREMEVRAITAIRPGDEITFFYPSTEWSMAQAFSCHCRSRHCLKYIQGAAYLSADILEYYYLADHIEEMLRERSLGDLFEEEPA